MMLASELLEVLIDAKQEYMFKDWQTVHLRLSVVDELIDFLDAYVNQDIPGEDN